MRPWAWGRLEDHPPIDDDESEDEYLTRTKQWLPGGTRGVRGGQAEVTMPSSLPDDISQ
jgi:hypothetical protein